MVEHITTATNLHTSVTLDAVEPEAMPNERLGSGKHGGEEDNADVSVVPHDLH